MSCTQTEIGSVGPLIGDIQDYTHFYTELHTQAAYRTRCWHGSRMMTWLPYMRQPGEQMFMHVTKNSSLTINARASWAN